MAKATKLNTGVIGLGLIGSRVVGCLRKANFQVWLWNRSPRPEPNFLSSPAEVAESAKTIQIFVADGPALLSILRDLAPSLTPEHIVMNHATVSPRETLEAEAIVTARHASFLDAPFTGSRDAASEGQLVYYIGGRPEVLAAARHVLEASSKSILEIGEVGQASVVKIATNLIAATAVEALAEAHALLHAHGIELRKLSVAMESHAARSGVSDMKIPCMLSGDFEPRFSLKNMFKDIQLALGLAAEKQIELPAASAFAGSAMAGMQRGWAESDFSVISRLYEFPGQGHTLPESPVSASASAAAQPLAVEKAARPWTLFAARK